MKEQDSPCIYIYMCICICICVYIYSFFDVLLFSSWYLDELQISRDCVILLRPSRLCCSLFQGPQLLFGVLLRLKDQELDVLLDRDLVH